MDKARHAPSLESAANIMSLKPRRAPYWNILRYCRHIGIEKKPTGECSWMARIRRSNGSYKQTKLGPAALQGFPGLSYLEATKLAQDWFAQPDVCSTSAKGYDVGVNTRLKYQKSVDCFTIGDALSNFIAWKRIAAAKTYFETTLSLTNHHIIPRLADVPADGFTQQAFTQFCLEVLESSPKRGNQSLGARQSLEDMDHEALRKRKKTLNTIIGILRMAIQMAWENGDIESDLCWRRIRRVPHADSPRQHFLTRSQAKRLIASCRPDLALLVQGALYTGCRVSELAQLRARDVGGHFYGIYVEPMKSYRGRYVVLPDEGMSFFLDQAENLTDEDLVFRMSSGKGWSGCHKHLFRQAVRSASLPEGFVFHGLRHTYASQLVQAGTPLAIVAKQLGHSNTDTVSRTYGHLCCDAVESEISKRFAPLKAARKDTRLKQLKGTLQKTEQPKWSWPQKNRSTAGGELVALLKAREAKLPTRLGP